MKLRSQIRRSENRRNLLKLKIKPNFANRRKTRTKPLTNHIEQMRATFWTLAAIIAATASLTNAVNIAGDASTAIDSADMNFAETGSFANPPPKPAPAQAPGKKVDATKKGPPSEGPKQGPGS